MTGHPKQALHKLSYNEFMNLNYEKKKKKGKRETYPIVNIVSLVFQETANNDWVRRVKIDYEFTRHFGKFHSDVHSGSKTFVENPNIIVQRLKFTTIELWKNRTW